MAYDFNKLLADTEQYLSKHRIPEEHREMYGAQLYLASLSFAVALLGKEDVTEEDMPRVRHLAAELERAANFYYKLWLEQIRRHKRGRPQQWPILALFTQCHIPGKAFMAGQGSGSTRTRGSRNTK
jgi:hypothetical protein